LISNKAIIKTDKEKLNAVLINLIKNAIKFTEKGSIEFGYEKKGEYLEFFVKDTGVGIPSNQKDIIFERFRQGSESLNRNYEGAGLGLSISKSYVEMLGGKIWVQSSTDYKTGENGSVFCFTIPYNPELTVTNLPKSSFSDKEEANQLRELNILIADDDMASELLLSRALKIFSKKTFIARSGIEAVEACRLNRDIDLILMDIKMPDMDGYEATRLIRLFNKEVIIIAQTAYAMAGEEDNALEAGCNYYISKPIKKNELMLIIKNHFKKS
jgi:CheY-like chemotaxis protein